MANDPPNFPFGATPPNASSTPALFGSSGSTLFGAASTGQPTGKNPFGGGGASKPTGSGFNFTGFGASTAGESKASNGTTTAGGIGGFGSISGAPSSASLGGSQTPQKPFFSESKAGFGNAPTAGTTSPAPTGSTTPANFSFNSTTTPAGPPPTDLFGGSTGGNGLFGEQDKKKPATNMFPPLGAPITTAPAQSLTSGGSMFSGDKANQPLPTFSWTNPSGTSQKTTPAATPSAEAQQPAFPGLGQSISIPPSSSATPSLFFQQPISSGAGSEKSKTFQFPSTNPIPTGASASGADQPKPHYGALATATPLNKSPTTSSAAPSANVFAIGGTTQATPASQTPTSSAAQTTSTSVPFNTLFKKPEKPSSTAAASTSTSQPGTTTTAAPASSLTAGVPPIGLGASVLGASTAGPTPPAQSRLRNKTMDEILTRWASDLTKYTKEFQTHAETVAHWDQLLVDNMTKISKLYVSAVTAEKQTASVEMQLSAVENQQNELESWLAKYEAEVDDLLAKNGSGQAGGGNSGGGGGLELAGPDQERERTYKLAERLSERLEDMGRDLGSMIEEINAANAGLSKTARPDEPITQIVRILNSHLSQLQAIDQGTVALQAKVIAAQKAAQGLGFAGINGSNGPTGGAASDDFYRSYMGRR